MAEAKKISPKGEAKKNYKRKSGKVVGISSPSTIRVEIESKMAHPKYNKIIKSHKKYLVRKSAKVEIKVGDEVMIEETKPVSKRISYKLVKKLK